MSTSKEIPLFGFIAEPLLVVSLLSAGVLLNRRRPQDVQQVNTLVESHEYKLAESEDGSWSDPEFGSGSGSGSGSRDRDDGGMGALEQTAPTRMRFFWTSLPVPDNSRFRTKFFSRVVNSFPFLLEVWYWLLTYWSYQGARAAQAVLMGGDTREVAQDHSLALLNLEKTLHLDVELGLQKFVMRHAALLWFFNKTYALVHIPATITFFGYAFRFFSAPKFQMVRRILVLSNLLAFVVFTAWPCMPPRLLPDEYGYADTIHAGKAASVWTTNKFQNQLAAFPSLHFGYSFTIGMSLFAYSPHRTLRMMAPAYPVLILLVIMATANHYLLDAAGGFVVTLVAYRFNRVLLNLRPIEEWFLSLIRTERPMDKARFEAVLNRDHFGATPGVGAPGVDVDGAEHEVRRPLMSQTQRG